MAACARSSWRAAMRRRFGPASPCATMRSFARGPGFWLTTRTPLELTDRYRIERELGRGGMATVYLAEDTKHRRKVALKLVGGALAVGAGRERFEREIAVAAGLS